ncbi:MAG: hypothetical protein A3B99_00150 [Candidatus Yanofskybacteria bacterium RIFCSPHIGHO2_02_FULL_44_12b]|uniref:Uncharacterized protein n=2 Tax=Candidatus Yanofskyibacteriota TaxID=1752733 RepID=A0A1F8GN71_9BACT|nr:MAG: hypothetical protein A2659_01595 [Candidatus Yanofskybacteria bacterium RIFCSPHIGHO2_01_FULL_44_24]OGN14757.1 MAG: hypothetical protein A3B99_00150 [Candidatus Yanofskybacteria bacterium RIFCSPHIGHO2_02_FULL_44_12b]OGN25889.1 MAG: hypothetical protein A2925_02515 [Candidatus Yanofskybacteria bacterium RIFCSPLOWO2_01_FULL_44_22]
MIDQVLHRRHVMAKKQKTGSKTYEKIKVTGRTYRRVSPKEVAEALGAEAVADPQKGAQLEKKFRRRP